MKVIDASNKGERIPGGPREPTKRTPTLSIRMRPPQEEMLNRKFLKFSNVCIIVSEVTGRGVKSFRGDAEKTREALVEAVGKLAETMSESEDNFNQYSTVKGFSNLARSDAPLKEFEGWLKGKEGDYASVASAYADLGLEGRRKLGIDPLKTEEQRHREAVNACATLNALLSERNSTPAIMGFHELIGSDHNIEGTDLSWGQLEKRMFDAWLQANSESLSPLEDRNAIVDKMPSEFISATDSAELSEQRKSNASLRGQLLTAQTRIENLEGIITERDNALEENESALEVVTCKLEALEKETKKQASLAEKRYLELEGKLARMSREQILEKEPDLPGRETALIPEPPEELDLGSAEEISKKVVLSDDVFDDIAALGLGATREMSDKKRADVTAPMALEKVGADIIESAREEKKGAFGKAMRAIFVYGIAGKGELQDKLEIIDVPIEDNFYGTPKERKEANERRKAIHELNQERTKEYNSWYNVTGRWIRNMKEGAIAAYANNTKKIKLAAAGAIGVVALAGIGAGVAALAGKAEELADAKAQKEFSKSVAALVESDTAIDEEPIAKAKPVKKVRRAPKPYNLKEITGTSLEKNGLAKVDLEKKGVGPELRQMHNIAKKIENDEEQFAVYSYLSGIIIDNEKIRESMSSSLVRDILVTTLGSARYFGEFGDGGPNGVRTALEVATAASGILDGRGGYGSKEPTKGQKVLVSSVREWIGTTVMAGPDAGVEEVAGEDSRIVDDIPLGELGEGEPEVIGSPTADNADGAPSLPQTITEKLEPKIIEYSAGRAEAIYRAHGLEIDGSPEQIYKKSKSMESLDNFLVLEHLCLRVGKALDAKEEVLKSRGRGIEMFLSAMESGILVYNTPKLYVPQGEEIQDMGSLDAKRIDTLMRVYELAEYLIRNGKRLGGKKMSGKQESRFQEIMDALTEELGRRGRKIMRNGLPE